MKILVDVYGNSFCPDDCPFCEIETDILIEEYSYHRERTAIRKCKNEALCAHAVECYIEQERQERSD